MGKYTEQHGQSGSSREVRILLPLLVYSGLLSPILLPFVSIGDLHIYLVTLISPMLLLITVAFMGRLPLVHMSSAFPLMLGLMVVLSSMISWVIGFSDVNFRDISEAAKYLQFIPYLFTLCYLSSSSLGFLHKLLLSSSIVVLFIGYAQVFNLPLISDWILNHYLGPDSVHIDGARSGRRIVITGSDPNVGGAIASFFYIYFLSLFFVAKKFRYILGALPFLFLCFFTQSRTSLVGLVLGVSFYFMFFHKTALLVKLAIFLSIIFLVILSVYALNLKYIYIGFQMLVDGENSSVSVRLDNALSALQRFRQSPITGMGVAKSEFSTIIDSEYALILQRYGLIGIVVFGSYIFYLIKLGVRNRSSHWGVALLSFSAFCMIFMLTNNVFSGYQLMSLVILLNIACILSGKKANLISEGDVSRVKCPPPRVRASTL